MSTEVLGAVSEKAMKLALRRGASEAQAVTYARVEDLTRFANSQIHQNVSSVSSGLRIKVVIKKRIGDVQISALDSKSIELAVKDAVKTAKVSPPNEMFQSLPERKSFTPLKRVFDRRTAEFSPNNRADLARQAIETAHRKAEIVKAVAGSCLTGSASFSVVNSLGIDAAARVSLARLAVTVISEKNHSEGHGYYESCARDIKEINVDEVTLKATDTSVRCVQPQRLEPGEYETVIAPDAVTLSMYYLGAGFTATSYEDGTSFVKYNLGRQVLDQKFDMKDDGRDMSTLFTSPIDGEGVPKRSVTLVHNGVVDEESICHDSYTAGKNNVESTGHAQTPFSESFQTGPDLANIVLSPGDSSTEEMINETKYGLYVSRFHYVRTVNRPQVIITGLTRDGTFLIKDGEISHPVYNLRFTDSLLKAYGNITMIGKEQERGMQATVPPLKVSKFRFTGVVE